MPTGGGDLQQRTAGVAPGPRGVWRAALVAAVLFLVTLAVYWHVRDHAFLSVDDGVYVSKNKVVAKGLTMEGLRWSFTNVGYAFNWHPLTWLSHMLDVQLFGLRPGGHHLVSVLLHAASVALLFGVLRAMTGALGRSAAVAALFGLHPLRVESVAWIAERKDVLSGLFWMVSLWAYLRWARKPGAGRYLALLAVFALGLLAKPMLVTLPFVLLLLDFWPLHRIRLSGRGHDGDFAAGLSATRLLLEKAPLLALSTASCVITIIAQAAAIRSDQEFSFAVRLQNALCSYLGYLGKTFWPTDLMILYPLSAQGPDHWRGVAAGLALAAMTLGAAAASRARPYVLTGWLWYLGTMFPVIGLIQVGEQARADRYTYLPLIGVALAVAWLIPDLFGARRRAGEVLTAVTVAVCVALAFLTVKQVRVMRDDDALYRHLLSIDPGNPTFRRYRGLTLMDQGRTEEAVAVLGSLFRDDLLKPSTIRPQPDAREEAPAWFREGNYLVAAKHYDLAVAYYRQAVALQPDFADAWLNLGSCYGTLGRYREAVEAFEKALAADPGSRASRQSLEQARRLLQR